MARRSAPRILCPVCGRDSAAIEIRRGTARPSVHAKLGGSPCPGYRQRVTIADSRPVPERATVELVSPPPSITATRVPVLPVTAPKCWTCRRWVTETDLKGERPTTLEQVTNLREQILAAHMAAEHQGAA